MSEKGFWNLARKVLYPIPMSLIGMSDKNTTSPLEPNGAKKAKPDSDRHISSILAHELNNLLTVVQGHADRLFLKHQKDAVLAPDFKKISDAAHRAAELVRNAPKLEMNPPTT